MKSPTWLGLFIGSTIGGMVPALWGAGMFSFAGIFGSFVGGVLGIWVGWRLQRGYL